MKHIENIQRLLCHWTLLLFEMSDLVNCFWTHRNLFTLQRHGIFFLMKKKIADYAVFGCKEVSKWHIRKRICTSESLCSRSRLIPHPQRTLRFQVTPTTTEHWDSPACFCKYIPFLILFAKQFSQVASEANFRQQNPKQFDFLCFAQRQLKVSAFEKVRRKLTVLRFEVTWGVGEELEKFFVKQWRVFPSKKR